MSLCDYDVAAWHSGKVTIAFLYSGPGGIAVLPGRLDTGTIVAAANGRRYRLTIMGRRTPLKFICELVGYSAVLGVVAPGDFGDADAWIGREKVRYEKRLRAFGPESWKAFEEFKINFGAAYAKPKIL